MRALCWRRTRDTLGEWALGTRPQCRRRGESSFSSLPGSSEASCPAPKSSRCLKSRSTEARPTQSVGCSPQTHTWGTTQPSECCKSSYRKGLRPCRLRDRLLGRGPLFPSCCKKAMSPPMPSQVHQPGVTMQGPNTSFRKSKWGKMILRSFSKKPEMSIQPSN
eukprot:Gregarina_sp_Pseudo_9__897@NODE_1575_length_1483_cov_13_910665_g1461_i0_p2_GENE_NODE_1575_length_1483_cov_13_910665_g1461_i0NODE_1575_length_1483_cov_13_910665_g1461_i0_p2_ORF_typecomplete_len163_score26_14DUF1505/PF07403_11/0_28_NODE_1575_length_1483_cov_13_910665_g1461_i05951083